jgi:putative radical SAM-modified peptide
MATEVREQEVLDEGRDEMEELNVCCTGTSNRK